MALRCLYVVLAFSMLIATGCRSRSNYQPTCAPAVVSAVPVQPTCPPGQVPQVVPGPTVPPIVVPSK